jgi:hypothetical protein
MLFYCPKNLGPTHNKNTRGKLVYTKQIIEYLKLHLNQ